MVLFRACILSYTRCHELSLQANRVCTGQSSDSERARDQWQRAAVTPQVNLSFRSCIAYPDITLILFLLAVRSLTAARQPRQL